MANTASYLICGFQFETRPRRKNRFQIKWTRKAISTKAFSFWGPRLANLLMPTNDCVSSNYIRDVTSSDGRILPYSSPFSIIRS